VPDQQLAVGNPGAVTPLNPSTQLQVPLPTVKAELQEYLLQLKNKVNGHSNCKNAAANLPDTILCVSCKLLLQCCCSLA
jgi:hypothetical protein